MRKRIVAILSVGVLAAGVCLYGVNADKGSSSTSIAETGAGANDILATEVAEDMVPEEPAKNEPLAEIEESDTKAEQSVDDLGFEVLPEEDLNNEDTASGDTLSLLTTHTIEFEDPDGYDIRETIKLSPIFTEDDASMAYTLWESLGNDVSSFPSKETLCGQKRVLVNYQLEYIIGTCMVENLTDGFSITSDNPRSYAMSLTADGNGDSATFFNDRSVSAVVYSSGMTYYSDNFSVPIGDARMESDVWGPCTFVIALPNTHTPNQPNGYRYDEARILFDYNIYDPTNNPDQDVFEFEYFKQEVILCQ